MARTHRTRLVTDSGEEIPLYAVRVRHGRATRSKARNEPMRRIQALDRARSARWYRDHPEAYGVHG